MAGSDGGLYVQSVVPGGPAAAVGGVHRGTELLYGLYYTYCISVFLELNFILYFFSNKIKTHS